VRKPAEPGVFRLPERAEVGVRFTYLCTTDGWVYLTVVMDLYDRTIIGWAFSADLEVAHTTVAAPQDGVHQLCRIIHYLF
jgi:transposase InsO family protein